MLTREEFEKLPKEQQEALLKKMEDIKKEVKDDKDADKHQGASPSMFRNDLTEDIVEVMLE